MLKNSFMGHVFEKLHVYAENMQYKMEDLG